MTNGAGYIPYQIVGQMQTEELTPDGRFVDVWRITFSTPSGTTGYVRIPTTLYEPGYVDQVIEAEVQRIEATHRLGGGPIET